MGDAVSRINGTSVSELNFNGLVSRIQYLPRPIIIHFVQLVNAKQVIPDKMESSQIIPVALDFPPTLPAMPPMPDYPPPPPPVNLKSVEYTEGDAMNDVSYREEDVEEKDEVFIGEIIQEKREEKMRRNDREESKDANIDERTANINELASDISEIEAEKKAEKLKNALRGGYVATSMTQAKSVINGNNFTDIMAEKNNEFEEVEIKGEKKWNEERGDDESCVPIKSTSVESIVESQKEDVTKKVCIENETGLKNENKPINSLTTGKVENEVKSENNYDVKNSETKVDIVHKISIGNIPNIKTNENELFSEDEILEDILISSNDNDDSEKKNLFSIFDDEEVDKIFEIKNINIEDNNSQNVKMNDCNNFVECQPFNSESHEFDLIFGPLTDSKKDVKKEITSDGIVEKKIFDLNEGENEGNEKSVALDIDIISQESV